LEKQWTILAADQEKTKALQQQLGVNETICRILVNRGIDNVFGSNQHRKLCV